MSRAATSAMDNEAWDLLVRRCRPEEKAIVEALRLMTADLCRNLVDLEVTIEGKRPKKPRDNRANEG
jgi:hypothetical protein